MSDDQMGDVAALKWLLPRPTDSAFAHFCRASFPDQAQLVLSTPNRVEQENRLFQLVPARRLSPMLAAQDPRRLDMYLRFLSAPQTPAEPVFNPYRIQACVRFSPRTRNTSLAVMR